MIRVLLLITVLALLITYLAPTSADAHTGTYQVSAGNGLNLRTGPGGGYARMYTMPNGTLVKARGHRGNWMYLTDLTTGRTGWAFLTYLVPYSGGGSGGSGSSGGGAICLTNYWGEYVCSSTDVGNAIRYWAAQYGLGWWGLAATAACESDFSIYAYNPASGVTGLFQFQPSTFYWQGGSDLYDPWDQSRVAAQMFANGLAYHFHCAQLIGWS